MIIIIRRNEKHFSFLTTSHTAPYAAPDGKELMSAFFESSDLDAISPQLYSADFGTTVEYQTGAVSWADFYTLYTNRTNPNLIICPSLWSGFLSTTYGFYNLNNTGGTNEGNPPIDFIDPKYTIDTGAKNFFLAYNIPSFGYIQWINGILKPVT